MNPIHLLMYAIAVLLLVVGVTAYLERELRWQIDTWLAYNVFLPVIISLSIFTVAMFLSRSSEKKIMDKLDGLDKLDKLDKLDGLDKLDKLDGLDKLDKLDGLDKLDKLDKLDSMESILRKIDGRLAPDNGRARILPRSPHKEPGSPVPPSGAGKHSAPSRAPVHHRGGW